MHYVLCTSKIEQDSCKHMRPLIGQDLSSSHKKHAVKATVWVRGGWIDEEDG